MQKRVVELLYGTCYLNKIEDSRLTDPALKNNTEESFTNRVFVFNLDRY